MYKFKFNNRIYIIHIIIFILLFSSYISLNQKYVNASNDINEYSKLQVEIPINIVNLYGYTSPHAKVELEKNIQSKIETFANSDGYFYFSNIPFASNNNICLTSFDRNERSTKPFCLNSKNIQIYNQDLGPLIIPPTLSLTSGSSKILESIQAKGESVPNSSIYFNLLKQPSLMDKIKDLININRYVRASTSYNRSTHSVKVDNDGYYSFNLPSSTRNNFIITAYNLYKTSISSYSNDLHFKVNSNIDWYIMYFQKLSLFIKIIILVALLSLMASLFSYRNKLKKYIINFYNLLSLKLTRTF